MTFKKNIIAWMVISTLSLLNIFCNENIPLREDLSKLITVRVSSTYFTTSRSSAIGKLRTFIIVTNKTDETIDDVATMAGSMEIVWEPPKEEERRFNRTRSFKLGTANIFYAKNFNNITKRLTMGPQDSVILFVDWNLKTNDSTFIPNYFNYVNDPKCFVSQPSIPYGVPRRISTRQNFMVKADVKMFDRLSVLYVQQVTLRHCFMFPHNGEVNELLHLPPCADFTITDPCTVIE